MSNGNLLEGGLIGINDVRYVVYVELFRKKFLIIFRLMWNMVIISYGNTDQCAICVALFWGTGNAKQMFMISIC